MKSLYRSIAILFLVIWLCPHAAADTSIFENVDKLYGTNDFSGALEECERLEASGPVDYEILWRLARSYSMAGYLEKKKSGRRKYLAKAIDYSRKAIELDGSRFEAHLHLSESLGILSNMSPPKKKVAYSREVRTAAERAIALEPSNSKAYTVLGMWHRKAVQASWIEKSIADAFLGGLPDASLEEAVGYLIKAVELDSGLMKSHYELALVYEALNKNDLARVELNKVLECNVRHHKDEETVRNAESLLKRLR